MLMNNWKINNKGIKKVNDKLATNNFLFIITPYDKLIYCNQKHEWLSVNKEDGKGHERAIQRDTKTFGMIQIYYFD